MHRASSVYRVINTVPLLCFSRILSFSLVFTAPLDQIVKRECSDENQYQITCCNCIDTAGNKTNWTCYPASRRMKYSTRVETPVIIGPSRTPRVGWTQKREPKKNKKKGILGVRAKGRMDPGHRSKDLVWALEEKGQGSSRSIFVSPPFLALLLAIGPFIRSSLRNTTTITIIIHVISGIGQTLTWCRIAHGSHISYFIF